MRGVLALTTTSCYSRLAMAKSEFFLELWNFMKVRKKFWIGPIVVIIALIGLLLVFTQTSVVAPFIYTLF